MLNNWTCGDKNRFGYCQVHRCRFFWISIVTFCFAIVKVKRGYSDRILIPGVIPTLECTSSFIKVTKLKTAMLIHIAVLLTYTESKIVA